MRKIDGYEVEQIRLPRIDDDDPHPSLTFRGDPVYPGAGFTAWIPGKGWQEIAIEMRWEPAGVWCWYVSYPEDCRDLCPIGLFCRVER